METDGQFKQHYQSIYEHSPLAFVIWSPDFTILDWNRRAEEVFGWSKSEAVGRSVLAFHTSEDILKFITEARRLVKGESPEVVTTRMVTRSGEVITCEWRSTILRDQNGNPESILSMGTDVTERLRADAALHAQQEEFRVIFESVRAAITYMDRDSRIIRLNERAERNLGVPRAESIGRTIFDLLQPEEAARLHQDNLEVMQSGSAKHSVIESLTSSGGKKRWLRTDKLPYMDSAGNLVGVIAFSLDITEQRQMEEKLRRAERLETAGRIAGQVAHDFNNLLGPVAVYPELIKNELPADSPAHEYCDTIMEAARQMADISADLMAFARRGRLETEPVDVNSLARQVVEHIGQGVPGLVTHVDLSDDLLPAEGSPSQIHRILQNLFSNAVEAMTGETVVTIATRNVYIDTPTGAYDRVDTGEYVRITVSDTGSGIPEEIRERIFDAFFSTKRGSRRGCGLGLTVVQSIVEDHHGFIDLESETGRGTTFTIYLPVSRRRVESSGNLELPVGSEKILLVDDDVLQRKVLGGILNRLGYEVEAVSSGEDALVYLEKREADLLILDMIMPNGMDGTETYQRVIMRRPGQKALLLSGYAETERVETALRLGVGAFLSKPIGVQALASAVRRELDRRG